MRRTAPRLASHAILIVFTIVSGYPLLWMIFGSLKHQGEFYTNLWFFPSKWEWGNYAAAWHTAKLGVTYSNSVIVTGVTMLLVLLIAYLGAYALARFEFPGNRTVMVLFLSTLMIPGQVTIIPLYQVELTLGIYNTHWGLILPYVAGGLPFAIFLMTAFIRAIPRELDESAGMDGCSRLGILWKIVFPLTKPAMATLIILTFIGVWNEFFLALVMIQDPLLRTIPVGMMYFNQVFGMADLTQIFAAMSIVMIPVVFVYVAFQKYFISGLTQGALKM